MHTLSASFNYCMRTTKIRRTRPVVTPCRTVLFSRRHERGGRQGSKVPDRLRSRWNLPTLLVPQTAAVASKVLFCCALVFLSFPFALGRILFMLLYRFVSSVTSLPGGDWVASICISYLSYQRRRCSFNYYFVVCISCVSFLSFRIFLQISHLVQLRTYCVSGPPC